jgi:hypothetical protein
MAVPLVVRRPETALWMLAQEAALRTATEAAPNRHGRVVAHRKGSEPVLAVRRSFADRPAQMAAARTLRWNRVDSHLVVDHMSPLRMAVSKPRRRCKD